MREVAAAVIIENGRLFLARRQNGDALAGWWELPGGKIEPGEVAPECLAREMLEEFEMTIAVGELIGSSEYAYPHGEFRLLAYHVSRLSDAYTTRVHDACGWFMPSEVPTLDIAPADIPLIDLLKTRSINAFRSAP